MNKTDEIDGTILRLEDGIFSVVFSKNTIISLEYSKMLVERRVAMSEEKEFPLYVDIRGVVSIDSPARKYLAGEEGTKLAKSAAIHVDNPMSKLFGNIFMTLDKPNKPTKLFTDKIEAFKWLGKQKVHY